MKLRQIGFPQYNKSFDFLNKNGFFLSIDFFCFRYFFNLLHFKLTFKLID